MPQTIAFNSPVSGFVIEKDVLEGQRIMAGDALYRVADLSVVRDGTQLFVRDRSGRPAVRHGMHERARVHPGREPGDADQSRVAPRIAP